MTDPVAVVSVLRNDRPDEHDNYSIAVSVAFTATARLVGRQHEIPKNFESRIREGVKPLSVDVREFGGVRTSAQIRDDDLDAIMHPKKLKTFGRYHRQLRKSGEELTRPLEAMRRVFEFLFSLEGQVELLHIFTNEQAVQWDWIYHEGKLLCEVFGVGASYAPDEFDYARLRHDFQVPREELHTNAHSALIVANSFPGDSRLFLPALEAEAMDLDERVRDSFGSHSTKLLRNATLPQIRKELRKHADTLRLMVMSGHYSDDGFLTSDGLKLDLREIKDLLKDTPFRLEPIIILNGCAGDSRERDPTGKWEQRDLRLPDENPNHALARKFLKYGAGGCIVTSTQVQVGFACKFVREFVECLLTPGTSVGHALLTTRRSLAKQDCYEWATYHLVGDPLDIITAGGPTPDA